VTLEPNATPIRGHLRATLSGDGTLGPIEERIGRRLCRVVDPESSEGKRLLGDGEVDLVGPGGERMGRVQLADALGRLRERLERLLSDPNADMDAAAVREGLTRIQARYDRIGRA
jgi:hypothetical protein